MTSELQPQAEPKLDPVSVSATEGMTGEPQPQAEPKTDSEPVSATEEVKKSSPAEAFTRLEGAVWQVHDSVGELRDFVERAKEVLFRQAEEYRTEGRSPVLNSLYDLHALVFKRVIAMEAGGLKPDAFVIDILRAIELELERHQVRVIRPEIGTPLDLRYMHTQGEVPAGRFFWRKPDTVAKVNRCGFATGTGQIVKVLQAAEVDVYRAEK